MADVSQIKIFVHGSPSELEQQINAWLAGRRVFVTGFQISEWSGRLAFVLAHRPADANTGSLPTSDALAPNAPEPSPEKQPPLRLAKKNK